MTFESQSETRLGPVGRSRQGGETVKLATANYGFRLWSLDDYLFAVKGLGLKHAEIGYTRNGTLQELYYQVRSRARGCHLPARRSAVRG